MNYFVGQIFIDEFPQDACEWVNNHESGRLYGKEIEPDENGRKRFQICEMPEPTEEEIAEQVMVRAKAERTAEVERLTVEVEGMVFDADETSQARMSVAASSMTDDETNVWVLHDNSVVQVTKAQLLLACRLARIAQSAVWTKPYEAS